MSAATALVADVVSAPARATAASLNDRQRLAVEEAQPRDARLPPPLLVIAGAGTGKTNTLAHAIAELLVRGADPQRLMLLTFSRRAAADLERRTGRVVRERLASASRSAPALPWAGTFHSVAARLLREYAERVGLEPQFTVYDRGDAEDLLGWLRHDIDIPVTGQRFPAKATCLAIYSRVVNSQAPLRDVLEQAFAWCVPFEATLHRLFAAYVEAKQAQNALDFDDLLLYWLHMLEDDRLAEELAGRFDHVLVDEYQDTNRLQSALLLALKPRGDGLVVVGDDAQAIYSFRAASVRNILDFPAAFDPPARVITLDRNYRSTPAILRASNAVIALARERFTKDLWSERPDGPRPQLVTVRDEAGQAECVAESILRHREAGIPLRQQAVLFRTSSHSAALELELTRRRIPYVKYGGLRFLESAHVKDVLAALRFGQNLRARVAGFRVLQLLPGVGAATAARVLDVLEKAADPLAALRAVAVPAAAQSQWPAWLDVLAVVGDVRTPWPASLDAALRWYGPHLERIYDDATVRQADLAQLLEIACTYASIERFLTELTLDPPSASSDEAGPPRQDDDYLILSTIHSAKGQEWKTVHVLNVVDGCIPSDMATGSADELEEERRLLYVAMTRAKDHLHLMVPQRFYVHPQRALGDRHVYAIRSRFIPPEVAGGFDHATWPPPAVAAPATPVTAREPAPRIDIRARLRAAWRG